MVVGGALIHFCLAGVILWHTDGLGLLRIMAAPCIFLRNKVCLFGKRRSINTQEYWISGQVRHDGPGKIRHVKGLIANVNL